MRHQLVLTTCMCQTHWSSNFLVCLISKNFNFQEAFHFDRWFRKRNFHRKRLFFLDTLDRTSFRSSFWSWFILHYGRTPSQRWTTLNRITLLWTKLLQIMIEILFMLYSGSISMGSWQHIISELVVLESPFFRNFIYLSNELVNVTKPFNKY